MLCTLWFAWICAPVLYCDWRLHKAAFSTPGVGSLKHVAWLLYYCSSPKAHHVFHHTAHVPARAENILWGKTQWQEEVHRSQKLSDLGLSPSLLLRSPVPAPSSADLSWAQICPRHAVTLGNGSQVSWTCTAQLLWCSNPVSVLRK